MRQAKVPETVIWRELAADVAYKAANLADLYGITSRQMERLFERDLGLSPKSWLTQQRMIAARHLLLEGNSIKEISYMLHYKQVSHFCFDFKRCYEMSPSEFVSQFAGVHEWCVISNLA